MAGSGFALWRGSPNHYDGRRGCSVTHITLHIMVGRLAGTDSCFQRASFSASSTYGIGSTGLTYQWVDEADGAWADADWRSDCSGISIEHEGGMAGVPVTDAEIEASARLCADIARRYGWASLWHDASGNRAGNVWLHREVPGTDHYGCPDRCVNALPVDRIINRANELLGGDMPTAQEIAEAVWNFDQNGVKCRDRLQGIDGAANAAVEKLSKTHTPAKIAEAVWTFIINDVQARDRLYGLDKIQVPRMYQILLEIKKKLGIK